MYYVRTVYVHIQCMPIRVNEFLSAQLHQYIYTRPFLVCGEGCGLGTIEGVHAILRAWHKEWINEESTLKQREAQV